MITNEILIYHVSYYLNVKSIIDLSRCTKALNILSKSTTLWTTLADIHLRYTPIVTDNNPVQYIIIDNKALFAPYYECKRMLILHERKTIQQCSITYTNAIQKVLSTANKD